VRGRHLSSSRKTAKQACSLRSPPCRTAQVIGASLESWADVIVKREGSRPVELAEGEEESEVANLLCEHE
jgi:hypothetical protein